jgi:addiction module RelE/StbE family toxin
MRKIILTPRFQRSLRKFIKGDQRLKKQIQETLREMEVDLSTINLSTHRLKGEFDGLRACSCGYDCRIIFSIEKYPDTDEELIILLNIGTHDDVY